MSEPAQHAHSASLDSVANGDFDWVTDPQNEHVRFLILPTAKRMASINVAKLSIEIRDGKIHFDMQPKEDAPKAVGAGTTEDQR